MLLFYVGQVGHTHIKTLFLKNTLLLILFWQLMMSVVSAAEFVFTPETPIVEVGKQLTLTVSNTSGEITWTAVKGQIEGTADQVKYIAPAEPGFDVVTVFDSESNIGTVKITVIPCVRTEECETLSAGLRRAAIIIAGGGNDETNTLWPTTESICNHIYEMLYERGFDKSEIYYLSPQAWADFNDDGQKDFITRPPIPSRQLIVDDVRDALTWAKKFGQLERPLYLFFTGQGGPETLQLAKHQQLTALKFKTLLDDYQNSTGNQLILVIDASHSGSFLKPLAAPNRAIISSAKAEEKAYFVEKQGFSHFMADGIAQGRDLFDAFQEATSQQHKELENGAQIPVGTTDEGINFVQTPQLDDDGDGIFTDNDGEWLKQIQIIKILVKGDFLTLDTPTSSTNLIAGQTLNIKTSKVASTVKRIWAEIRPPRINLVPNAEGTPILAFPRVNLSPTDNKNVWQATWNDAVYNGDYEITFYAKDKEGNIASSDNLVIIHVTGGVEAPPQATVQIVLEKDHYHPGDAFKAELIENLGWGYDLYAAVVLPDGQFLTLTDTNQPASLNEATKWRGQRIQNSPLILLDLSLSDDLATGEYCLYGILSPEREKVLEMVPLWVMAQQCFEVF